MKFQIKHEIKGRLRIHMKQSRMTFEEADILHYAIQKMDGVSSVKVYERTGDAVICFHCSREELVDALSAFDYDRVNVPMEVLQNSGRQLNAEFQEKLAGRILRRLFNKIFLPMPLRNAITLCRAIRYVWMGIKCLAARKIEVPVLDATAITVSILRGNFNTAGSIMFLLGVGELLEDWTHKKSVGDLARSMSLNTEKVWVRKDEAEKLVPSDEVEIGDLVVVHMGNIIPFDGIVCDGEAMVNQSAMTGEPLAVKKDTDSYAYAGTVVEEGELVIRVKETRGSTKYEKIVSMIEETDKLKSASESQAEHLADRLVPYTLLGTALVWLLTRNATKALAVLMVDFSCALKLAMPVTVLSAIREAGEHDIMVKGGKYMEAVAEATTIVFDKTGTLTKAMPVVRSIVNFSDESDDEMLRIAACLEEHFPHSMAKAVVDAARKKGLEHAEMHSKVNYIVAHGISSEIDDRKVVIGSYHFIFEDEKCIVDDSAKAEFENLPEGYSHLYMAIDGKLVAVICIEDPLREEAADAIRQLKEAGITKVVMMTGDSERTAAVIAKRVGVDEYYSEVLPEDKASFIQRERENGAKTIMVGDGINDSPALSAANVGIAISDGAELAREIADITIGADNLYELVTLKKLSNRLMKRIDSNYRSIVGINSGLIGAGVFGLIPPTTSAMFHNISTLGITLNSMKNLLPEQELPQVEEHCQEA